MEAANSAPVDSDQKKGIRIYKIKGVDKLIVARKGGPTKEQVKTSPSYAQLRKNQQEFGLASGIAKTIRQSFTEPVQKVCESYISGKLTARIRSIMTHEEGTLGKRPFLLSKHAHNLVGFQFNQEFPFSEVFKSRMLIRQGQHRGHMIFHVPSFIPEEVLSFPEGATHFKLFAHMIALSDYTFDESTEQYARAERDGYGLHAHVEGPLNPILRIPLDPQTFHISLQHEGEFAPGTTMLLMVGVQFFTFKHTKYQLVEKGHSMELHKVN